MSRCPWLSARSYLVPLRERPYGEFHSREEARDADMLRTAIASLAASACLCSMTACSTNEPTEASSPSESGSPIPASDASTAPAKKVPAYLNRDEVVEVLAVEWVLFKCEVLVCGQVVDPQSLSPRPLGGRLLVEEQPRGDMRVKMAALAVGTPGGRAAAAEGLGELSTTSSVVASASSQRSESLDVEDPPRRLVGVRRESPLGGLRRAFAGASSSRGP